MGINSVGVAGCWMAITPGNGILNVAPNMNINVVAKIIVATVICSFRCVTSDAGAGAGNGNAYAGGHQLYSQPPRTTGEVAEVFPPPSKKLVRLNYRSTPWWHLCY